MTAGKTFKKKVEAAAYLRYSYARKSGESFSV